MTLPHRFPCVLVDRVVDRAAIVRVSAGAWWSRDQPMLPWTLCAEAAAQAAGRLLAASEGETPGWALAGIESATQRRPIGAGETLAVEVRVERRMGAAVRVVAELTCEGERVAEMLLTLAARPA